MKVGLHLTESGLYKYKYVGSVAIEITLTAVPLTHKHLSFVLSHCLDLFLCIVMFITLQYKNGRGLSLIGT